MKITIKFNPKSGLDNIETDVPDNVYATPIVVWCNATQTAHLLGEDYIYNEVPFMFLDKDKGTAIFRDRLDNNSISKGEKTNGES